jgi:hypothetical protein
VRSAHGGGEAAGELAMRYLGIGVDDAIAEKIDI